MCTWPKAVGWEGVPQVLPSRTEIQVVPADWQRAQARLMHNHSHLPPATRQECDQPLR